MPKIIDEEPAGLPYGTYDIFYYTVLDGRPVCDPGMDANVPLASVDRLDPEQNEIAVAVCKSQPGGAMIYGSEAAKAAWLEWENRQ